MGIEIEVLFSARLTADETFALPERLNTSPSVVEACRAYCAPYVPDPWRWTDFQSSISSPASIADFWASPYYGAVWLSGAATMTVCSNRIHMGGLSRVVPFADDLEGCQTKIRGMARAIARELGTDRVLYFPDGGAWPVRGLDDGTFDDVLARLTAWGPPVPVLGVIGYVDAVRDRGFHYADGALRRADGTAVPESEIMPGRGWLHWGDVVTYADGRPVPPEELAKPDLRGGFGYFVDDFHDLA